jgi:hypothetical protein
MSDKPLFQSGSRMFTSPDPSSTAALSYDVYAYPSERNSYSNVGVMANDVYLFSIDIGKNGHNEDEPKYDYVKTFDDIIDFFKEARDQAMAAERFLDEHSNG